MYKKMKWSKYLRLKLSGILKEPNKTTRCEVTSEEESLPSEINKEGVESAAIDDNR